MEKFSSYTDIELCEMLNSDKRSLEEVFLEIYRRYSKQILTYCKYLLRITEDAEDIFQQVFTNFYMAIKNHKKLTNIIGYLVTIAKNEAYNKYRSKKIFVDYDVSTSYLSQCESNFDSEVFVKMIDFALSKIPYTLSEVFVLKECIGFSYKEISDITKLPVKRIYVKIHRAKKQIRKIIEHQYINL